MQLGCKCFKSPLAHLAEQTNDGSLDNLERIEPYYMPPWQPRANVFIQDRNGTIDGARKTDLECAIFTDACGKTGTMGIGVTCMSQARNSTISKTVGSAALLSVHDGGREACRLLHALWPDHDIYARTTVTVYSDSQSALRTLTNPR